MQKKYKVMKEFPVVEVGRILCLEIDGLLYTRGLNGEIFDYSEYQVENLIKLGCLKEIKQLSLEDELRNVIINGLNTADDIKNSVEVAKKFGAKEEIDEEKV